MLSENFVTQDINKLIMSTSETLIIRHCFSSFLFLFSLLSRASFGAAKYIKNTSYISMYGEGENEDFFAVQVDRYFVFLP